MEDFIIDYIKDDSKCITDILQNSSNNIINGAENIASTIRVSGEISLTN